MRPATDALKAFLANWTSTGAQIPMVDLYTFLFKGGEIVRLASSQIPITAPAPNTDSPLFTFAAAPGPGSPQTGVPIDRSKITEQIGVEVSKLQIKVFAGENDELAFGGTITWQSAVFWGLFDGCYCRVWRGFIDPSQPPGTVVGTVSRFYGRVGDIVIGRDDIEIEVNSLLDLLTVQMPRILLQSSCPHVFGEPGVGMCGYDRVNGLTALGAATGVGQVTITCGTGSSQNSLTTTFAPHPSTAYDNGTIVGLTGQNAGLTRTLAKLQSGNIYYLQPWVFPVVAGTDTFNLLPGCDRTLGTCTSTYHNQLRYGGTPDIPPPETAI